MGDFTPPVVIASSLDAARAGMLRELLESAGISARSVEAVPGMSGGEVAVPAADAERAMEIARSAGFLGGPGEPVEIPDEEWRHGGVGSDEPAGIPEEESPRERVPVPARRVAPTVEMPRRFPWALALAVLVAAALFYALSSASLRQALEAWLAKIGLVKP